MRYLQSRINDYREMELVSIIQSEIAEPLWYYFDSSFMPLENSCTESNNKYLLLPSIQQFISKSKDIATYDTDDISLILGYDSDDFANVLNNFIIIGKKSEIILWVSIDEPNNKGIDIETSTTNTREYKNDEIFDYYDYKKESLIDTLNDLSNYYLDIKNVCYKTISIVNELCDCNSKSFVSNNKSKIKK